VLSFFMTREIRTMKSNSPGASWRRGLDRAEPLFSPQGKMQTKNCCGARCAPCRKRLRCTPTAATRSPPFPRHRRRSGRSLQRVTSAQSADKTRYSERAKTSIRPVGTGPPDGPPNSIRTPKLAVILRSAATKDLLSIHRDPSLPLRMTAPRRGR